MLTEEIRVEKRVSKIRFSYLPREPLEKVTTSHDAQQVAPVKAEGNG